MAQALVLPLLKNGEFLSEDVFGVVGHQKSVESALARFPEPCTVVSSDDERSSEVWTCPIKLLAVKPQQFEEVKKQFVQPRLSRKEGHSLLISLMAGISLNSLEKAFPGYVCVRAVPNTPALVGAGLTGLAWGQSVTSANRESVMQIFEPVSEVFELPEDQLDAFLALTSSGPAYVAVIAEALADGAVAAGLSRSLANHLAHRTLAGTALLLKKQQLHPGQLKDLVTSPAGTTITALRHLEKSAFRSALIEAVVAAAERSRELA